MTCRVALHEHCLEAECYWKPVGGRLHVYISKSITRGCISAAFLCVGQVWVTDLPSQLHSNEHHTVMNSPRCSESVKWDHIEDWGGEKGKVFWVREAFGSVWTTVYKRKVRLLMRWWPIRKFAHLEALRVCYSSRSVASPKLTIIKEMMHFPDQLALSRPI